MRSRILSLFFALIIFAAGFVFGAGWQMRQASQTQAPAAEKMSAEQAPVAHLMIDFGDQLLIERNIKYNEGASVFSITQEIITSRQLPFVFDPPGDWGVFIRQIGEKKNGQDNRYWQYWVNHEQVQVAADRYQIKPNDVVEWKFAPSQQ